MRINGFTSIMVIGLFGSLVIILGAVSIYFQFKSDNAIQSTSTQSQPVQSYKSSLAPTPNLPIEISSKESLYSNEKYKIRFEYPENFSFVEKPNTSAGQFTIEIKSELEELVLDIQTESSVPNWPGNTNYESLKSLNSLEWKYFPSSKFCDGGSCTETSELYRYSHNGYSYHFILRKISVISAENIISTFEFTD